MAAKIKKGKVHPAGKTGNITAKSTNSFPEFEFWKSSWLPALITLITSFVLYSASLGYGYILDDKIVLSENSFVKNGLNGLSDIFGKESFTGYLGEQKDLVAGARYRPLSIASFAIEYKFFKLSPKISHFFNILFYALTGLIIFRVLSLFFPNKNNKDNFFTVPFIATVLFILHPLHTEVVANIKGRDEIFAVLFSFIAIWCSFRQFKSGSILWSIFACVFFLLGMLGKENAIMLVPIVPLSFLFFQNAKHKELFYLSIPYLIASFIFLLLRTKAIGFLLSSGNEITELMNNPFSGVSFADKSATIFYTLGIYLKLLFYPSPLTYDYYPYHIPIIHWANIRAIIPLLIYISLVVIAIWGFKKKWMVSWVILFYITTLFITSNFVFSVGTFMNERFLFMPSIAFCIFIAWLITDKLPSLFNKAGKYTGFAILLVFVLGFTYKTFSRIPDWKDQETLDYSALKVSKNSARANSFVGYNLYRKGLLEKDLIKQKALFIEALPHVNRALEIYPEYSEAITAKAGIVSGLYQQDGKLDTLLNIFEELLARRHVEFIDQYMEYLNHKVTQNNERQMLVTFYHNTGFEIFAKKNKDYVLAKKYLDWGRSIDAGNPTLIRDLILVNYAAKNYKDCLSTVKDGMIFNPSDSICIEYLKKLNEAGFQL